jgi:hypothetical protein
MHDASLIQAVLGSSVATMTCLSVEELEPLHHALELQGYRTFVADLSGVEDEGEMFLRVVAAIPDSYSALHNNINSAALADVLREVIWDEGQVAVIVENADELLQKHLNLLFELHSTIILVTHYMRTAGATRMIRFFLVGSD